MNPKFQLLLQQLVKAFQGGDLDAAGSILKDLVKNDTQNIETIFDLGFFYVKANRLLEASMIFEYLQPYKKDDVRIPYNLGIIYSLQGNNQLALQAYDLALQIQPNDIEALVNKGAACNDTKNYVLALEVLEKAIQLRADIPEAWSNKGIALTNLNFFEEALEAYSEAVRLNPAYHEAWLNKSVPLNKLSRYSEALESCDKALTLQPNYVEAWSNKGIALHELKLFDEALTCFDKALTLQPNYVEAWSNKGIALHELKLFDEALTCFDKALALQPNYVEAWTNKGATLHKLKHYDEALTCFDKALALQSNFVEAWSNKGTTLHKLKRYDQALTCFEKGLYLRPNGEWILGDIVHTKMEICSWSGLADLSEIVSEKVMAGEKVSAPFSLLPLNDDIPLHKKSSEIYVKSKYPSNSLLGPIIKSSENKKIRVGYFSADFHNHATGYLIAEILELRNKSQFELVGFSFGPMTNDEMRQRLEKSFDQFIEVGNKSDIEVAQLSRSLNIDIAVDLKGYTQDSRAGIFSYRAAPIQVNFLGYPGTMGADYIDYIIADKTLIPIESQLSYTEKVVYLPDSYQANDRRRLIADKQYTRDQFGLPDHGFVFCCFNNNFKILPPTFHGWMKILKAVEGSVIWLLEDNSWAVHNLKNEASRCGIEPGRLIFAERISLPEHLARHHLADLFLDTFPCNAHTTASDALWTGLPVLTLIGKSFSSRVAASLLNAIGLSELIVSNQKEYEALAIELAMNPKKLSDIKFRLANNRLGMPLFDAPLFTKNLEAAYSNIYKRYQAGLKPDHVYIT